MAQGQSKRSKAGCDVCGDLGTPIYGAMVSLGRCSTGWLELFVCPACGTLWIDNVRFMMPHSRQQVLKRFPDLDARLAAAGMPDIGPGDEPRPDR